jgi:hypothetical protein
MFSSNTSHVGVATGQQEYTSAGTYTWICPTGVTSVSVLCVNPGAAYGGSLAYKNNIPVTPGASYTVVVAPKPDTGSTRTYFSSTTLVSVMGRVASNAYGDAAFDGGVVGYRGGGGAAGYSGAGGAGGSTNGSNGSAGSGGGGGGGASSLRDDGFGGSEAIGGTGGGVGLQGQGSNGAGGVYVYNSFGNASAGSGGSAQTYGGGGSYTDASPGRTDAGAGAVRIIWPGNLRQFPSTRTANE